MDEPRIGIRICDCKGLVSDHLDTARVEQAAGQLQGVVHLARTDHLCAPHQLAELEQSLRDVGVRRLLFAGCSARSSLKFPQQRLNAILQRLGIDKALLEVANLREQCAWLHKDREAATCKGMDQLRMAHARLIHDQACLSPAPLGQTGRQSPQRVQAASTMLKASGTARSKSLSMALRLPWPWAKSCCTLSGQTSAQRPQLMQSSGSTKAAPRSMRAWKLPSIFSRPSTWERVSTWMPGSSTMSLACTGPTHSLRQ